VCVRSARTDLCGGVVGTAIPTATTRPHAMRLAHDRWVRAQAGGLRHSALRIMTSMRRREFFGATVAAIGLAQAPPKVKLGIDLFSLRSQNWTAMPLLEYSAKQQGARGPLLRSAIHRGLETENLKRVRRRAEELGIEMRSE